MRTSGGRGSLHRLGTTGRDRMKSTGTEIGSPRGLSSPHASARVLSLSNTPSFSSQSSPGMYNQDCCAHLTAQDTEPWGGWERRPRRCCGRMMRGWIHPAGSATASLMKAISQLGSEWCKLSVPGRCQGPETEGGGKTQHVRAGLMIVQLLFTSLPLPCAR